MPEAIRFHLLQIPANRFSKGETDEDAPRGASPQVAAAISRAAMPATAAGFVRRCAAKEHVMKRKSLLVLGGVVVAVGLIVWSQRFDLALNHMRGEGGRSGGELTALAWSILDDFTDRPELEAFVREQLLASAKSALETGTSGDLNPWSLLGLSGQVYRRQPERVDEEILTAALVVHCLNDCSDGAYGHAPGFTAPYWSDAVKASEVFRKAMRAAALVLARHPPSRRSSFVAIAGALADGGEEPDPAVAAAVAAFVIAANPDTSETGWLTDALDLIAGPAGGGVAWATALADAPAADLSGHIWKAAVDGLRRSPPLTQDSLGEAVLAHCMRRSAPPAPVDEGCIDLGLAWRAPWAGRLQAAASRGGSGADIAELLLLAHQRQSDRTWRNVIADWQATAPPPDRGIADQNAGSRWSAMTESAYQPEFPRGDARDIERLLAAGAAAFPAVAAQYRTARHPEIVTAAAFVLTKGSPQTLSAAVMERIEAFRPLAFSFVRDPVAGAAPYALEGRRIAVGLLALQEHGNQSTRIHPLILALSIPERGFSEYASATLRKTLSAGEFADALFGFLAIRKAYLVIEVDAYRDALMSYEDVSPAIEKNLTRLLAAARGRPEGVPWILKVIGLSALGTVGGSSARPVLGRYAGDSGSYLEVNSPSDDAEDEIPAGGVERQFARLVQCALHHLDTRQGVVSLAALSSPVCDGRYE
jgi:hypothetical protein